MEALVEEKARKVRGASKEKRVPRSLNCHLEKLIKSIPARNGGKAKVEGNPPLSQCEQCDAFQLDIRREPPLEISGNIGATGSW